MSVLRYFARHSLVRLFAYGIGVAAAFLVTPRLIACLGKDGYGLWALISTVAAYYLLLDFGLIQSVSKFAAAADASPDQTDKAGSGREIGNIYSTAQGMGAGSALLTLLIAGGILLFADVPHFTGADRNAARAAFAILSASVAAQLFFRASFGLLAARLRWTAIAVLSMFRSVGASAAVLIWLDPALPFGPNILRVALINGLANVLEAAALRFMAGEGGLRFQRRDISPARARELFRFGLPLLIISLGNTLRTQVQVFFAASALSLAQAGVFALARQFTSYMDNIMSTVFGIMNPYFSRMQARGGAASCGGVLLDSLKLSYALSSYIGLCLAFYGGLFVARWLGPGFAEIPGVLVPLALAAVLGQGLYPANGFLIGVGRHSFLASVTVMDGVVNAAACLPAVLLFGLPGVGWLLFFSSVIFRGAVLPPRICAAAALSLPAYYRTVGGSLAWQGAIQGMYFLAVRPLLSPDYLVLFLVCAGQFMACVAALYLQTRLPGRFAAWRASRISRTENASSTEKGALP